MQYLRTSLSDWLHHGGRRLYQRNRNNHSALLRLPNITIEIFNWIQSLSLSSQPREFGRGPECATYADLFSHRAPFTFSNCGERNTVATLSCEGGGGLVPPGVQNHYQMFFRYSCCGGCIVDIPEFELLYFLDEDAKTTCVANRTTGWNNTANISAIASKRKRADSLPVTAVSGTYTL